MKTSKIITATVSIFILILIAFYSARIFALNDFASQSKPQIIAQLQEAKVALSSLNPSEAQQPLREIQSNISDLKFELEKYGVLDAAGLFDNLTNGLKGLPKIVQEISGISGTAIHINEDLLALRNEGLQLLLDGPGEKLLAMLDSLIKKLNTLNSYLDRISQGQLTDTETKGEINLLKQDVVSTKSSLVELRKMLDPKKPIHLLALFQNESELRPAGGFIGSYGDLTIASGTIRNIEIRDIYDPDGQLDVKVIPPKPLQRLTRDWEARDANWFFDYPTSAKQVISFLNQSKIYSEKEITFSGAIAINTKVLSSIISLIGPIHLPEYKSTLTAETFLIELQREVESGENKKINQPKKILQTLAPILIEKFKNLDESKKKELLAGLRYHFAHKNIMIYVDNQTLQKKLDSLSIAGSVTPISTSTSTLRDYLAVVSANMAGGKSDYVTRQIIELDSSFNASGTLVHNLSVRRKHTGENELDWWYLANNKTYTQIYLPLGSKLEYAAGALPLPKNAGWDYRGYKTDPTVSTIEQTERIFPDQNLERFIAFGKTVFAGWINTPAGKTSEFKMIYKNPKRFDASIKKYEIIFDKQSGANTAFLAKIKAPDGYIWQETKTDLLIYENEDPEGKVILFGTLQKI